MLREDGRKSNQFRDIEFKIGFDKSVNGSCMYKQGLTEIVCLVNGPKEKTQDELLVIEYSVSPFSNIESKRSSKFDKDFSMFAENLRHSFQNLILIDAGAKTEIQISVCVIQNDGSQKSAIFNALTLGLMDAGVPMKDFLVSTTVGILNGQIISDLTQDESRQVFAELAISYQQRKQKIDYCELRTQKVSSQEVDQMMKHAQQAAEELYKILRTRVLEQSVKRLLC